MDEQGVVQVSVIICTRNRAASLGRTLASLAAGQDPGVAWELVIVDNGSTDGTAAVARGFADLLPVRVVEEPTPGLSQARNRGVATSAGRYIVWTDDDVTVGPDWLRAYVDAFRRYPGAAVFGGPIRPRFDTPPPAWIAEALRELEGPFALRDFGPEERVLEPGAGLVPFGANFAIRATEQRATLYDTALGAGSGRIPQGEEVAVITAILAGGVEGRWVPQAAVAHHIEARRMTRAFVAGWFRNAGLTEAYTHEPSAGQRLFGAPRWLWRSLPLRYLRYRCARSHRLWARRMAEYQIDRGALAFWRTQGRAATVGR